MIIRKLTPPTNRITLLNFLYQCNLQPNVSSLPGIARNMFYNSNLPFLYIKFLMSVSLSFWFIELCFYRCCHPCLVLSQALLGWPPSFLFQFKKKWCIYLQETLILLCLFLKRSFSIIRVGPSARTSVTYSFFR